MVLGNSVSAVAGDWEAIGGNKTNFPRSSEPSNSSRSKNIDVPVVHMDSMGDDFGRGKLHQCEYQIRELSEPPRRPPTPKEIKELEECRNNLKRYIKKGKGIERYDLRTMGEMVSGIDEILNPGGGSCTIRIKPNFAEAGEEIVSIGIVAYVPQRKASDGVSVRLSEGSASLTGGRIALTQGKTNHKEQIVFSGDACLNGQNSKPGETSSISVFTGRQSCASAAFKWKDPEPPKIRHFICRKDEKTKKIFLGWSVKGAKSVNITGCPDKCPSNLNPKEGSIYIPVPLNVETATFILTAKKFDKEETQTRTVQLKGQSSPIVLLLPINNSTTTEESIKVKGRVSPTPPVGYRQASIYVEGQPAGTAVINSSGVFEWRGLLKNKTKKEHLVLKLPDKTLKECGEFKSKLYMGNSANMHEISNTIKAVVKLEGGEVITASARVRHLPRVTGMRWSTSDVDVKSICANAEGKLGPDDTHILDPNKPIDLDAVKVTGVVDLNNNMICDQSLRMDTTVGSVTATATYTININNECD
jgi:hypothetical protein